MNVLLNTHFPNLKSLDKYFEESNEHSDVNKTTNSSLNKVNPAEIAQTISQLESQQSMLKSSIEVQKLINSNSDNDSDLLKIFKSQVELESATQTALNEWYNHRSNQLLESAYQALYRSKWPANRKISANDTLLSTFNALKEFNTTLSVEPLVHNTVAALRLSITNTDQAIDTQMQLIYGILDPRVKLATLVDLETYFTALSPYLIQVFKQPSLNSFTVEKLLEFASTLETKYMLSETVTSNLISGVLDESNLGEYLTYEQNSYLAVAKATNFRNILVDVDLPCALPNNWAVKLWKLARNGDYLLRLNPKQVLENVHLPIVQFAFDELSDQVDKIKLSKSKLARAVASTSTKHKHDDVSLADLLALLGATSFLNASIRNWSLFLPLATSGINFDKTCNLFADLKLECVNLVSSCLANQLKPAIQQMFKGQQPSQRAFQMDQSAVAALANSKLDAALVKHALATDLVSVFWNHIHQNVFNLEATNLLYSCLERVVTVNQLPNLAFTKVYEAIKALNGEECNLASEEIVELKMRRSN